MASSSTYSIQDSVETDLSKVAIARNWSDLAIDDGSHVLRANEYAVRLISRNGNIITTPVDSLRYRDEVDAAQNPRVEIPPNSDLIQNQFEYLGGSVQLFIDGQIGFAGEILKIESSQVEGDNISIKCKNPGRRLADDSVDFQPDNTILQDVMAKMVDRTNSFHAEMDDLIDSATLNGVSIVDDVVLVDGTSGTITFSDVDPNASEGEYLKVKAYTDPRVTVTIQVSGTPDYSYELTDLDANNFGEWATVPFPALPEDSYDLVFELEEGSFLFDWISVTENRVTRNVTPPEINQVGNDEFFYSRSGSELDTETDSSTEGVVWDSDRYRCRQKSVFYSYTGSNVNTTSDPDAVDGETWVGGISATFYLDTQDAIEEWDLYARQRLADSNQPANESYDITTEIDNTEFTYGLISPSSTDYEWDRVASGGFTSDWPNDVQGGDQLSVQLENTSDIDIYMDAFVLVHGDNSSFDFEFDFDNTLDSNQQLSSPHEYATGEVTFTSVASNENITDSETDASMNNTSNAVDSWGPSQRISSSANFPSPQSASTIDNAYPYTGVSHQVKVKLSASGSERTDGSPTVGYQSMEITDYSVNIGTNDLEIIYDQNLTGNRLEIISELADSSTIHYRWEGNECEIFQEGTQYTDPQLRKEEIGSSIGIEDVYSSVEVIGVDGVSSGIVEADDPPDFVDRHKELREQDIETELDAQRRAISFLRENSTIEYEGDITTLPTFAPVGQMIDGSLFEHGQDMVIEQVRYGKRRSTITLGFKQKLSRKVRGLNRTTTSITRQQTTSG